jgi:hypothetical protein
VHWKPPAEWTKPDVASKAPPPVRKTAPEPPEMSEALKPKPVLPPGAAETGDDTKTTARPAMAAAADSADHRVVGLMESRRMCRVEIIKAFLSSFGIYVVVG